MKRTLVGGSILVICMLLMIPAISATQYKLTDNLIEQTRQQIPKRKGFHPLLSLVVIFFGFILGSYSNELKEEYGVNISGWLGIVMLLVGLIGGKAFENLFRFN